MFWCAIFVCCCFVYCGNVDITSVCIHYIIYLLYLVDILSLMTFLCTDKRKMLSPSFSDLYAKPLKHSRNIFRLDTATYGSVHCCCCLYVCESQTLRKSNKKFNWIFFHFARECLCAKDKTHALTAPYKHCTKRARTHTHTVHMTTTTEKTALSCWLAMSISILQFCYKSLV